MREVVVDANVFVSLLTDRNETQRKVAKVLLLRAEDGEVVVILSQFVLFEIAHVLRNLYGVAPDKVAALLRDTIALPGVVTVDDCPWSRVLEHLSTALPSVADAALVSIAIANRYDSIATFDHKLEKQMKKLGVSSYW